MFRRDEDLLCVAREAAEVGAKALWLQLRSRNEEAAGFDTGVISSKRQVVAR